MDLLIFPTGIVRLGMTTSVVEENVWNIPGRLLIFAFGLSFL
jgi:hypothetical protein